MRGFLSTKNRSAGSVFYWSAKSFAEGCCQSAIGCPESLLVIILGDRKQKKYRKWYYSWSEKIVCG